MATFAFTARDGSGRVVRGSRAAGGEVELRRTLRDEGIYLVRAKSQRPGAASRRLWKVKTPALVLFTFNLQNIIDAGVPLLSGLEDMREETGDTRFRDVIGEVIDGITGGETLAQALRHHPNVFDSLYVNMVDAGEQSGRLPQALERLLQFLEWNQELRSRIRELVAYPIVVLVAMVGLIGLVIGFVFPRFADIFRRVDLALPLPTRVLMGTSDFFTHWWFPMLIGLLVVWAGTIVLARIPRVKLIVHAWWMKVPVIGDLVTMLNFSLVARALASFLGSGIPVPQALDMISRIVPNRRVGSSVIESKEAILSGSTMTEAFRDTRIFPPLVLRMVKMGEQSGRVVEALEKAATIYDREIPVKTKRVLGLVNPALTAVIGGMLMFVILAVMMPLYGMYQQIGSSY